MPLLTSLFSTTWRGQVAPRHLRDPSFDCEAHRYQILWYYVVDSKGLSISSGLPTWIVSLEASQGVSEISCETDWIETMSKVKREFPKYGRLVVKDGDTVAVFAKTGITAFDPADEYPYVAQVYRVVAERSNPELTLVPLGLTTRVSAFDAKKLETVDVRL